MPRRNAMLSKSGRIEKMLPTSNTEGEITLRPKTVAIAIGTSGCVMSEAMCRSRRMRDALFIGASPSEKEYRESSQDSDRPWQTCPARDKVDRFDSRSRMRFERLQKPAHRPKRLAIGATARLCSARVMPLQIRNFVAVCY